MFTVIAAKFITANFPAVTNLRAMTAQFETTTTSMSDSLISLPMGWYWVETKYRLLEPYVIRLIPTLRRAQFNASAAIALAVVAQSQSIGMKHRLIPVSYGMSSCRYRLSCVNQERTTLAMDFEKA